MILGKLKEVCSKAIQKLELFKQENLQCFLIMGKKSYTVFEYPINNKKHIAADNMEDLKSKISILRVLRYLPDAKLMIHGNGFITNVLYI